MKLEQLRIGGFGRLRDLEITFGDGLTVIAGPNEAGKSTIVECILRLLFGFPETQHNKARKKYEPWTNGGPYAATLRYRLDSGEAFEIWRDFARPDVPTMVVEAVTRRPVQTGNKGTSPGESALHISLDVYRAAAVVRAGDFAEGADDAAFALAERLAEVIGSAGDASAEEAIERLTEAYRSIGQSGANTPLGKAAREADEAAAALHRFRSEYQSFVETIRERSELSERAHNLAEKRSRCGAALAAARLRSVRARITEASDAQRQLEAALERRRAIETDSVQRAAIDRRDDIETAIDTLRSVQRAASDAAARASERAGERETMQRDVDGASAALLEKRALVARLDETIAAHERAAAGRPAISAATLSALEREADDADAAEGRARNLETAAAIARQRQRPSSVAIAGSTIAFVALLATWLASHALVTGIGAVAALLLGIGSAIGFVASNRKRREAIARAEASAQEATASAERALTALESRCREMGCSGVAAVRAARTAQMELDRIKSERDAAHEAAALLAQRRDALAERFAESGAIEAERRTSQEREAATQRTLDALLDEAGIAAGGVEERIATYRRTRDAGEFTAHADAGIANARAALERALAGGTVEALENEEARHAMEAAAGEPGEFADRPDHELERVIGAIDDERREVERELDATTVRISEFDRTHPVPAAELEERAAVAAARRDRYRAARDAMEIAWKTIEQVKDAVHRNFAPPLNAAIARSIGSITAGRYTQAFIDPADFTIRVVAPGSAIAREAGELSTGTIEQLQFALRATLAAALGGGERVPILFDDALAHADDARVGAALARAAALADEGEQIIFFTQHGSVEALAARLPHVKVLELEGPPPSATASPLPPDVSAMPRGNGASAMPEPVRAAEPKPDPESDSMLGLDF